MSTLNEPEGRCIGILPDPGSIKALAIDLDGTVLAPGAVLTERTAMAINKCRQKGLKIIIVTGRSIDSVEPFRSALNAEGPMVYFNGALVAEMPGSMILKVTLLDTKTVESCIDISRETGAYLQVFYLEEGKEKRIILASEWDGEEREMYRKHTGLLSELGDLKETLRRQGSGCCIKAMFLAEPEQLAMLRLRLEERLGGSIYVTQTFRTFLEIMDAGVSKGEGLKFALKSLSLRTEEVIAFGDEENDIPMLDAAGFSVAPANAKDAAKASASLIVGTNSEDGVAVFLEEFFQL